MTMEAYDEVDTVEAFGDFESTDEATSAYRPGSRVYAPGGISTATLQTRNGTAKLNLPSAVPTLAQFRKIEQALNATIQRVNGVQAELVRVRRELALRTRDQGQNFLPLMLTLKVSKDLKDHTHSLTAGATTTGTANLSSSGGGFSSFLPLLLLAPGLFGQSSAGNSPSGYQSSGTQDAMSPLMMFVMADML